MSTKPTLGRLEKVHLREVWVSEPYDFTPWLAEEENLKLLGEAIDLDLELIQTERNVGTFSCDILAKDVVADRFVAIENQLEMTDHMHLGQLLTYAAGLEASAIIWVSRSMKEEHRQALDWLNSKTSEEIAFYGVEVELWRIGGSNIAPKFSVVARPNNYQKLARQSKESAAAASGASQLYLDYFTALKEHLAEKAPHLMKGKPNGTKWFRIALGKTGFALIVEASQQKRFLEVRFYVYNDPDNHVGRYLQQRLAEIRAVIPGATLALDTTTKHTSVDVVLKDADPSDLNDRQRQLEWLGEQILLFNQVFRPMVKDLPNG